MPLKVKCNQCDRIMNAIEVMTHVTIYLGNKVAPTLEPIIIKAIEAYKEGE
jgi:hypothetical protein